MPFVKLDCGILDSSLWLDCDARDVFLTALLMASPFHLKEPALQLAIRSLDPTGWKVPIGWYGIVESAGTGIVRREGHIASEAGLAALERLGSPDPESRSDAFDGRRLARINGGFLVLNYQAYRDRDYTHATRQRNYIERQKQAQKSGQIGQNSDKVTPSQPSLDAVTHRHMTQAEVYVRTDPTVRTESSLRVNPSHNAGASKTAPADRAPLRVIPPSDVEAFRLSWNTTTAKPIPPCLSLTTKRRREIRAALTYRDLTFWTAIFERVARAPFCCGVNRDGWVISLDWLLGGLPDRALKVLEGRYDEHFSQSDLEEAKSAIWKATCRSDITRDDCENWIRRQRMARKQA